MRQSNRVRDDSGSATVLAAAFITVLVAIWIAGIAVGSAVIARHRAQAAADLAALAAASRLPAGAAEACRYGGGVAASMGAQVRRCFAERLDITIAVTVPVGGRLAWQAGASARAGPVRSG